MIYSIATALILCKYRGVFVEKNSPFWPSL